MDGAGTVVVVVVVESMDVDTEAVVGVVMADN